MLVPMTRAEMKAVQALAKIGALTLEDIFQRCQAMQN